MIWKLSSLEFLLPHLHLLLQLRQASPPRLGFGFWVAGGPLLTTSLRRRAGGGRRPGGGGGRRAVEDGGWAVPGRGWRWREEAAGEAGAVADAGGLGRRRRPAKGRRRWGGVVAGGRR